MRDISQLFAPTAPPELVRAVMTAQPDCLQAAFDRMRESFDPWTHISSSPSGSTIAIVRGWSNS